ncbi:MAG: hypothetical protein IPK33_03000 [Gemmatimonadetes bacterium]|nr:hypothetical protein [Gemmatimonadota bacterium]
MQPLPGNGAITAGGQTKTSPTTIPTGSGLKRTVVVSTTPPGATVRLLDANGVVAEGVSPHAFVVDPGDYGWEVQLEGYLRDRSLSRSIGVTQKPADTVQVELTPVGDMNDIVKRADSEYSKGNCGVAMDLYEQVARPAGMRGEASMIWLESRYRLGQCAKREQEYDKAQAAFRAILEVRRDQWPAKLELGLTACAARSYNDGLRSFREMEGPYLGGVSAEKKQAVRVLARYGAAVCNHQDYERQEFPDRFTDLRESTVGALEEFIEAADALEGKVPADAQSTMRSALQDAKARLLRLQRGS